MLKKKPKFKISFKEWSYSLHKIKDEINFTQPLLHVNCYGSIQLENCKKIIRYNENEMVFDLGVFLVLIAGDKLVMHTLTKESITVTGTILSLSFSY